MFKIRVYDKSDHPTEPIFWILTVIGVVLVGILFLFDAVQSGLSDFILYVALALIIGIGVIRLIQSIHYNGPIGDISYLTVNSDSIQFMNKNFNISMVDEIIVRLRNKEVQYSRIENNYLKIRLRSGEIYKLAVLISGESDITQVEGICNVLKKSVTKVTYENKIR